MQTQKLTQLSRVKMYANISFIIFLAAALGHCETAVGKCDEP